MLGQYVAERQQRYEIVACGGSTTSPETSPKDDAIWEMKRKLRDILPKIAGTG
jgi:hypothetical protein